MFCTQGYGFLSYFGLKTAIKCEQLIATYGMVLKEPRKRMNVFPALSQKLEKPEEWDVSRNVIASEPNFTHTVPLTSIVIDSLSIITLYNGVSQFLKASEW